MTERPLGADAATRRARPATTPTRETADARRFDYGTCRSDGGICVTALPRERRKEGAKHIKT